MDTIRARAVAAALPDGRVLVASGYDGSFLSSAEVFTPPTSVSLPASVDFGSVRVGEQGPPRTLTVTNTGNTPLWVTGVTIGGTDAESFAIPDEGDGCTGAAVPARGACEIELRFTPRTLGGRTATLAITDNAGTGSHQVTLTGAGAAPDPGLAPALHDFGQRRPGAARRHRLPSRWSTPAKRR